ncbi:MAG TPA: DUF4954 domain-containing protein, partial [Chitinophagaceae bacterium]|nr:DUF4954 domain-containing protein [Chitinophagaceae bacterium]
GADGEIVAGRGFWPGLCVSLKHNSKFASFTLIAKGDFPAELNIPIPFSLVSNDVSHDKLVVMPAYWFQYNMYALARNSGKYNSRDKRTEKIQQLEYDYLAPDSVNEIFDALQLIKQSTARAWALKNKKTIAAKDLTRQGEALLEKNKDLADLEILADGFENTSRKVQLIKAAEAASIFKELVVYYGITQLLSLIERKNITSFKKLLQLLPAKPKREAWTNVGGQLMPSAALQTMIKQIHSGRINTWDDVHGVYGKQNDAYADNKAAHAFASLLEVLKLTPARFTDKIFTELLQQTIKTREWMTAGIYESRAKDYRNPFRKMVYETDKEMEKIIGKLKDNSFIKQQQEETVAFKKQVQSVIGKFSL